MITLLVKKTGYVLFTTILLIKFRNEEYTNAFTDILWLAFVLIGLVVSLTFDEKDPKISQRLTARYIFFSVAVSIGMSMLVAIARAEDKIDYFWFYALTISASTFAPFLARKILKSLPNTIDKGLNDLAKARLKQLEGNNDKTEDDGND